MAFTTPRIFDCDGRCFEVCLPTNQNLFFHGAYLVYAHYHSLFQLFRSKLAPASNTSDLERTTKCVVSTAEVLNNETLVY